MCKNRKLYAKIHAHLDEQEDELEQTNTRTIYNILHYIMGCWFEHWNDEWRFAPTGDTYATMILSEVYEFNLFIHLLKPPQLAIWVTNSADFWQKYHCVLSCKAYAVQS